MIVQHVIRTCVIKTIDRSIAFNIVNNIVAYDIVKPGKCINRSKVNTIDIIGAGCIYIKQTMYKVAIYFTAGAETSKIDRIRGGCANICPCGTAYVITVDDGLESTIDVKTIEIIIFDNIPQEFITLVCNSRASHVCNSIIPSCNDVFFKEVAIT